MKELVNQIKNYHESQKRINPKFSLRKMASQLEISPGELSEIIKGKRNITIKKAQKILNRLPISPAKKNSILQQIINPSTKDTSPEIELDEEEFNFISDPIHFSFLAIMNSKYFNNKFEWIAHILQITVSEAYLIASRLEKIGLVKKDQFGILQRCASKTTTSEAKPSRAIIKAHKKDLEKAIVCLDSVPINERDYSSLTILFDPDKIEEARLILRKAQDDIEALSDKDKFRRVYKVATYFYPISRDLTLTETATV